MSFIVAIDGPAASGKGTIAAAVAKQLGFDYLNTGELYRMVAFYVLDAKIDINQPEKVVEIIKLIDFTNSANIDLHQESISRMASIVAAIPQVRYALLEKQRSFPKNNRGAVLEGRDIGTVIFPDADIKFYITASLEERARRRFKQLQKKGEAVIYDDVLRDIKERDLRDSNRGTAPLLQGTDYKIIDTTDIDINSAIQNVLNIIQDSF